MGTLAPWYIMIPDITWTWVKLDHWMNLAADPARSYLEVNEYVPLHPGTRSWEVERQAVIIEKVIGKGAFGQVA